MFAVKYSISRRLAYNFPITRQIRQFSDSTSTSGGSKSKSPDLIDSRDEPIKFSTSPAFRHKRPFQQFNSSAMGAGQQAFGAVAGNPKLAGIRLYDPWFHDFQEYVVWASLAIFLIYFGILREENDIDEEISRPLHERIPQIEMEMLKDRILLGKLKNEDVSNYEKRLQELENKIISSKIRKG